MIISRITLFQYTLPLTRKINVAGTSITHREGYLIAIEDENGNSGYGEISPLPGLDTVTLHQCRNELLQVKRILEKRPIITENLDITSSLLGIVQCDTLLNPHVMFGTESALLGLYLKKHQKLSPDIIGSLSDSCMVNVNGLYIPDTSEEKITAQLNHLKTSAFSTIKVKIGRISIQDEIVQIQRIWHFFNKKIILRLDANKSLSYEDYSTYHDALNPIPMEYVEEPLSNGDFRSAGQIPWPLAVDESLNNYLDDATPDISALPENTTAVIIKPGSFTSLSKLIAFIKQADSTDLKVILSSAFNTSLTILLFGILSSMPGKSLQNAHGFDTLKYLKQDVIINPPVIQQGRLILSKEHLTGRMVLNKAILRRVN